MMIRSLGPRVEKKFTAPKIFEPSASEIDAGIVASFVSHQEAVKNYFIKLQAARFEKTVIGSPVSSLITYLLSDALKLIVAHEQRHLGQAIGILNHPNFPK